jgi:hypothetical protein
MVINPMELFNLPTCLPINARAKNHIQEIVIQESVNPNFSIPEYEMELVPITPIVSIIAWGFNKETEVAKAICFFGESALSSDELELGLLFQVTYPINPKKIIPIVKRTNFIQ